MTLSEEAVEICLEKDCRYGNCGKMFSIIKLIGMHVSCYTVLLVISMGEAVKKAGF